jgi:multiple sugar transport system substrate-binding protein
MPELTRRRFLHASGIGALAMTGGLGSLSRALAESSGSLKGRTITHWSFLSPSGKSLREQAIKQIVENFQKTTGATVKFQTFPWQDLGTKLIAAAQAGSPPDSSRVNIYVLRKVVQADALMDLDSRVAKTYPDDQRKDFTVDFAPSSLVDGKKWTMQVEMVPKALFIRKDWLDKTGLAAPKTWEEFVKVAKAFTGNGRWGYMFGVSKSQLNQVETLFQPQIHGRGGKILDDKGAPVFNNDAAVATYKFLSDCIHTTKITPPDVIGMTYDDVTDAFKSGRVGIIQEGSHRYRDIAQAIGEENLLLAKVPSDDPNTPSPSVVTGWGIGLPKGSANADAAWKYITYYINPESQEINAKVAGTLPTRKSVLERPYFQTPEAAYMRWWIEYVAERGESIINVATFDQLNEVMDNALQQILLDPSTDIKAVLDSAVEEYAGMTGQ